MQDVPVTPSAARPARRRKADEPSAPEQPELKRSWRLAKASYEAVPPAIGRVVTVERGEHGWSVALCAPAVVMGALLALAAAYQPQVLQFLLWLKSHVTP